MTDRSGDVAEIQRLFRDRGWPLLVDGVPGPMTRMALAWQRYRRERDCAVEAMRVPETVSDFTGETVQGAVCDWPLRGRRTHPLPAGSVTMRLAAMLAGVGLSLAVLGGAAMSGLFGVASVLPAVCLFAGLAIAVCGAAVTIRRLHDHHEGFHL